MQPVRAGNPARRRFALALAALIALPDLSTAQTIGIPLRGEAKPEPAPQAARPAAAAPKPQAPKPQRAAPPPRRAAAIEPLEIDVQPFQTLFVVGEAPITGFDVEQRARLIEFGAQRRVPDAEQRAVEELIDEELKLLAARREGVAIDDEILAEAFQRVLDNNRLSEEAFLKRLDQAGVERPAFERQLRADILWGRTLRKVFGERFEPTEGEISAMMETSQGGSAKKFYDVRQFFVPVEASAPSADVRAAAEKAILGYKSATSCRALDALKQEHGEKSVLRNVVPIDAMPSAVRALVTGMKVGERAEPKRSPAGFHMFMLCGVDERAQGIERNEAVERLRQQRIDRLSANLLEDTRRTTFIEQR